MSNILESAKNAASTVAEQATTLASNAISTAQTYTGVGVGSSQHAHSEEHLHRSTLPPDSEVTSVRKIDSDGLAAFEGEKVRHEVLVKINKLAIEDARHGLKEVAELDLVGADGVKKGISYYHPLRYFTINRPFGIDYIGEIEIEEGKSIHVRVHKASPTAAATFHSLDTRPSEEGGAVFATGEPLGWFDY